MWWLLSPILVSRVVAIAGQNTSTRPNCQLCSDPLSATTLKLLFGKPNELKVKNWAAVCCRMKFVP